MIEMKTKGFGGASADTEDDMFAFGLFCLAVNLAAAAGAMYPITRWWERAFHIFGALCGLSIALS